MYTIARSTNATMTVTPMPNRLLIILCVVCSVAADARAQLATRVYASGFTTPLAFVQDPTDRTVQFVVEQHGRVRVVRNGVVLPTEFLNLSTVITNDGGEHGLLGFAFAPDYAVSGRFFVNFTNLNGDTVVARFKRSGNPLVADPSTRLDLHWGGAAGDAFIKQPFANHNGGNLVFGPDGYLYIGMGDGGSGGDPQNNAQTPSQLLGKILRVDVNVPDSDPIGYAIPADNPFVDDVPAAARHEIWAFGMRNPWRFSFDDPARGGNGALIIADVGQEQWEEIDYEPANRGGRNYGWRFRQGAHDFVQILPPAYLPLTDPVSEYDHTVGQSITGGYVYRGRALGPTFQGRYFFGDFVRGRIWSLAFTFDTAGEAHASGLVEHTAELGGPGQIGNVSSFGIDADGELYIVSYSKGQILKVLAAPATTAGIGDLFFRNYVTGANEAWRMTGTTRTAIATLSAVTDVTWRLVGSGDFNGDGQRDLIWRNAATGTNVVWFMNASTATGVGNAASLPAVTDMAWQMAVVADLNGDARPDIIWRNVSTGANLVWYMNGVGITGTGTLPGVPDLDWQLAAVGDLNNDGHPDFVWRNLRTGVNIAWFMNGVTITSAATLPALSGRQWELIAAVDVNGDHRADLLWHDAATGANTAWIMNGNQIAVSLPFVSAANQDWSPMGPATHPAQRDFNADGHPDIIWRDTTGVATVVWYMNDLSLVDARSLPAVSSTDWQPVGTADFDRDGQPDIVWWNSVSGAAVVWFMRGTAIACTAALPGMSDASWRPAAIADMNGDGRPDIVWRNAATGGNVVQLLNGASLISTVSLPAVPDPAWTLVAAADLNVDGHPDFFWRNTSTGATVVWYMLGATIADAANLPTMSNTTWLLVSVRDLDGDGHLDLIWRNPTTGANVVWYMYFARVLRTSALPAVTGSEWKFVP
jgi:glucose/arabinose dehydrogenase